ncbi:hemolymph lipopolysaccharide-binding protein-like [Biomphalaria glabrata]|uniref:Hemolymph lipopolysaccharide-binding protein-like n=1 Tax=Biomphalaria glabrata TaxID=6526 RepID=A0A9W3AAQ1_BIOGL|nr:hemolymph lipopolysaccharide-binding protein-like [Biomphalaria glabrata]
MILSILFLILCATVVGGQTPPVYKFDPKYDTCGSGSFSDFRMQYLEGTYIMCLRWSDSPLTFFGARNYCQIRGTRLGVFDTMDKMKILQTRNNLTLIGLDDLKTEGKFIWHNGAELNNAPNSGFFNEDEPSNSAGIEDCVVLHGSLLNDVTCTTLYDFVCELV